MKLKKQIFDIIQPSGGKRTIASSVFDIFFITLIVANVLLVILETFSGFSDSVYSFFRAFEVVSVVIFTIEYVIRLWTSNYLFPDKRALRARVKYGFSFMAVVDLLAILPFYLPLIFPIDLRVLRMLRLLRLIRLFKINRYTKALSSVGGVLKLKASQLISSVFVVLILMIMASVLMYAVENETQPGVFTNALSGLWWAVATLTTVGYGDIYPVTLFGQAVGAITALLGIGFVAIPTAIISSGFMENLVENKKSKEERPQSDEADELLRIYEKLDVRRRVKLLDAAFALEEEKTNFYTE